MKTDGLYNGGIYWLLTLGNLAVSAEAAFIPAGALLTRINSSESHQLASICGISTENANVTAGRRYPWAVSIMYQGKNRLGGTIISPHHILTAAHAFVRFDNSLPGIGDPCLVYGYRRFATIHSREVAFGDDCIRYEQRRDHIGRGGSLSPSFMEVRSRLRQRNESMEVGHSTYTTCKQKNIAFTKIRAVYVDDDFAQGGCLKGHDWAIIEVVDRIDLQTPSTRPICLPSFKQSLEEGQMVMIVGWGRPNVFGVGDPLIRQIPMVHNAECKAPWSDSMPSKNADYLCARALDPNNDDSPRTCHGDSGSGLEQRDFYSNQTTLLGITSFGSRGCPANELARFTKVANYLDRICELTGVCYTQTIKTVA